MVDQTVSLRLEGDASELRREVRETADTFDDLAGRGDAAGEEIDDALAGLGESVEGVEETISGLDSELAALADADRAIELGIEAAEAEAKIAAIDEMLSDPSLSETQVQILVDEQGEARQRLEELQAEMVEFGEEAESVSSSGVSMWDEYSGAVNGVGGAFAAAGAGLEAFNRKQQDVREVAGRVANAIEGETADSIIGLATEVHDATRDLDEMVQMMEIGRQQGIRSGDQLQDYAVFWDTVGDATGETAAELAKGSSALRAIGIDAGNEAEALEAFGFVAQETTGSLTEFLHFIDRTGPELRELGLDINDTAAFLGVMEQELGMSGRTARQEFRTAVRESDGDLNVLLETLGVTEAQFSTYTEQVSNSSGVIDDNATAFKESRTTMQEMQATLEGVMANFSGVGEAIEFASVPLMATGGLIVGLNQLRQLAPTITSNVSSMAGAMRRNARQIGAVGAAVGAATIALQQWQDQMAQGRSDAERMVDFYMGGFDPATASVQEMHDALGQLVTLQQEHARASEEAVNPFLQERHAATAEALEAEHAALTQVFQQSLATAEALGLTGEAAWDFVPAAEGTVAANEDSADAFDANAAAAEEAATAFRDYADAMRAGFDPMFAMQDAADRLHDAQVAVAEATAEHGEESAEAQEANRDATRAAVDFEASLNNLRAEIEEGNVKLSDAADQLDAWVEQGVLTEDQARQAKEEMFAMAEQAAALDGMQPTVEVHAEVERAEYAISRVARDRDVWLDVKQRGVDSGEVLGHFGARGGSTGGFISGRDEDPIYRAMGGPVGTDTVPLWATPGEYIVNADAVSALGVDTMHAINRAERVAAPAMAGVSGGGGAQMVTVQSDIYLDGDKIGSADSVHRAIDRTQARRARNTAGMR